MTLDLVPSFRIAAATCTASRRAGRRGLAAPPRSDVVALYGGLVLAPPDYQQNDAFRIVYVHAPCATAVADGVHDHGRGRRRRSHLAHQGGARGRRGLRADRRVVHGGRAGHRHARGASRCGATYWVWDPRLTSELVLLFLYLGYMGLRAAIEDPQKADKASAVLAIVGVVNVPIINYSVNWWNSLHQRRHDDAGRSRHGLVAWSGRCC